MDALTTRRHISTADPLVADRLTLTATPLPPGLVVVEVRGEVTDTFFALMKRELQIPPRTVLLDLTSVNFFCASGIAALLEMRQHCVDSNITLRLVAARPLRRPLELVGLGGTFTSSENTPDAVVEILGDCDEREEYGTS